MNRREALSSLVILMGSAVSSQTLHAIENICTPSAKTILGAFSLTEMQRKIVAEVAEHIIPKTATPGAKDTGVPAFIEMMLKDCYKKLEQESFMEGVMALEKVNFLSQSSSEQVATLKKLEQETIEAMKQANVRQVKVGDNVDKEVMEKKKGIPFWRLIKELTLLGYYTSEQGMNASFVYEPIPGKFENIKIKSDQKSFAY
jgi:Gluconate 2-dehydrogenase subunit 3